MYIPKLMEWEWRVGGLRLPGEGTEDSIRQSVSMAAEWVRKSLRGRLMAAVFLKSSALVSSEEFR